MTSGGIDFNDFPEIVPTAEIMTKIEKTFLVFSSVAVGLFLERGLMLQQNIIITLTMKRKQACLSTAMS